MVASEFDILVLDSNMAFKVRPVPLYVWFRMYSLGAIEEALHGRIAISQMLEVSPQMTNI